MTMQMTRNNLVVVGGSFQVIHWMDNVFLFSMAFYVQLQIDRRSVIMMLEENVQIPTPKLEQRPFEW